MARADPGGRETKVFGTSAVSGFAARGMGIPFSEVASLKSI